MRQQNYKLFPSPAPPKILWTKSSRQALGSLSQHHIARIVTIFIIYALKKSMSSKKMLNSAALLYRTSSFSCIASRLGCQVKASRRAC